MVPSTWMAQHISSLPKVSGLSEIKLLNPNPRARKAYLTRNRASNNVVATPGFDPRTSRTPAP